MQLLEQYCRDTHGVKIGARSLGTYLEQWGLSASSLYGQCKDAGDQADWLNTHYKTFTGTARQNNATVFWMGRNSATINGEEISIAYAHTTRGKYHWIAQNTSNHVQQATDFLQRLISITDGPIAVVLADQNILNSTDFRSFVQDNALISLIAHPHNKTTTKKPADPIPTADEPDLINRKHDNMTSLTHLQRLEAESIHIMREVVANADKPVMLLSLIHI